MRPLWQQCSASSSVGSVLSLLPAEDTMDDVDGRAYVGDNCGPSKGAWDELPFEPVFDFRSIFFMSSF